MTPITVWHNNIVGHEVWCASQFLAHPGNYKLHPQAQGDAVDGSLGDLGWVKSVIVNVRTGLVLDGHLRVTRALRKGDDTPVPVELVDLDPALEPQVLLLLDELAREGMQAVERDKVDELLQRVRSGNKSVQALLDNVAQRYGILPKPQGVPVVAPAMVWHSITVQFRNEQELHEFALLLGRSVPNNTRSIWYKVGDDYE